MKVSINTIKKYTKINIPIEELISMIKSQIGEVEEVNDLQKKYKNIIVAEIATVAKHPDSEKLHIYKVDIGTKKVQVVAGGPALNINDRVAYMPVGTKVPFNPAPEKKADIVESTTIKGVKSDGMIASEMELDLGPEHTRVMLLTFKCKPGDSFAEKADLNDIVIDIENKALTNRPDLFGVIGIAREIAGIQNIQFTTPDELNYKQAGKHRTPANKYLPIKVSNNAEVLVPRYMAVSMKDVSVGDSPLWLKAELVKIGMRPINNVVDITNYIMYLTGQPLHAFDYDKVVAKDKHANGHAIINVRLSQKSESLTTLDGKTHEIKSEVLICDSANPIAIGGVMGGLDSEVDRNTKNVIIECANFDMYNIRKTSMKQGIITDAVTRYSRSQDPNQCEHVIHKAIDLFAELTGAVQASDIYDEFALPRKQIKIRISHSRLNMHIGHEFTLDEIKTILQNVELYVEPDTKSKDHLNVIIPTYRQDLTIPEDIHEEVARLYGYNKLAVTLPTRDLNPSPTNKQYEVKKLIRNSLTSIGAYEALTYNFVGKKLFEKSGQDLSKAYHLTNAISPELEYMKTSLLPALLAKAVPNIKRGYDNFGMYEINKYHIKGDLNQEKLPKERDNLSLVYLTSDKYSQSHTSGSAYYQAKYYLEELNKELKLPQLNYELLEKTDVKQLNPWIQNLAPMFEPKASAIVYVKIESKRHNLGILGEFTGEVHNNMNIPEYAAGLELEVDQIVNLIDFSSQYIEPSRYPKVTQDLCFVLDRDVPYLHVENTIRETNKDPNLEVSVQPYDIYQSDNETETKQTTYRVIIQHREKTLNESEIGDIYKKVVRRVLKETGGKLKE